MVEVYKDLGVLVSPTLDFSEHLIHVVRNAPRLCSLIFRMFIIRQPDFYIQLYKSLILPHFMYCSTVWRPYSKKSIEALESVQKRFVRRLAFRCGLSRKSICLRSIADLHREADIRMYRRLSALGLSEDMFSISSNNLRSCITLRSLQVARSEKVNNMFSFRVVRLLR